jgi:hypothetical protein
MARFATKSVPRASVPNAINLAGGEAHTMSPKLEFASALSTSFLADSYYASAATQVGRIADLAQRLDDPLFAAKAAVFNRRLNGLRSVSHLVAGELAKRKDVKGLPWLRAFYRQVVVRPDDITETLAYLKAHGAPDLRKLSNALKRGFGDALTRFDAYQLAKYAQASKDVSMVDAVNLLHPKSTPALQALMKGTLGPAETWEAKLSATGKRASAEGLTEDQTRDAKGQVWLDLLQAKKLGYLATLRNLRNIADQSPEALDLALPFLTNPNAVANSKVFPFQFFTAMEAIAGTKADMPKVRRALNEAMDLSMANVPAFDGPTLIALDNSGSMAGRPALIAALFAAVLFKSQKDADVLVFSDSAVQVRANPGDSLQTLAKAFKGANRPAGTNFHAIFQTATRAYRRIIILSDMQAWVGGHTPASSHKDYKRRFNADPTIISFNLNAQDGTMQFPEVKVCALAGFSDTVLGLMEKLERDPAALVHEIEAVEL